MELIESIIAMQKESEELRRRGAIIALVPTMGYFHEGHLSLMRYAKKNADKVITSLYVNPTQFAPNEDFSKYPRDFERDYKLAKDNGTDYLFFPNNEEIYPVGFNTYINIKGITEKFEGKTRPTHFNGVATVVAKLFNITKPHLSVFGQKDYQQTLVIKQLVRDLNFDIKIIVLPTYREHDGLAMSSRNVYLSADLRAKANIIFKTLSKAKDLILSGEKNSEKIEEFMKAHLNSVPEIKIDYASAVCAENLVQKLNFESGDEIALLIAAYLGSTRLIDNMLVKVP